MYYRILINPFYVQYPFAPKSALRIRGTPLNCFNLKEPLHSNGKVSACLLILALNQPILSSTKHFEIHEISGHCYFH